MRPELALQIGQTSGVATMAVSPDGRLFASGGVDGTVKLWDAGSGSCIWTVAAHPLSVGFLGFGPAGDVLVSCGSTGNTTRDVRLWDVATGQQLVQLSSNGLGAILLRPRVGDFPFSPDGRWLAVPFVDEPKLVSIRDRRTVALTGIGQGVLRFAWSGNSRRLAVAGRNSVSIRDVRSLATVAEIAVDARTDTSSLSGIALDSTGQRLAFVNSSGSVVLWNVRAGQAIWTSQLPGAGAPAIRDQAALRVIAIHDEENLVVGVNDWFALAWGAADGRQRYEIPLASGAAGVAVSAGRGVLAVLAPRKEYVPGKPPPTDEVSVWDLRSGELVRAIVAPKQIGAFALDAEGRVLIADDAGGASVDSLRGKSASSWDVATGTRRHLSVGWAWPSELVAWSPDGRFLAAGPTLRLWDLRTGSAFSPPHPRHDHLIFVPPSHNERVLAIYGDTGLTVCTLPTPEDVGSPPTPVPVNVDLETTTAGAFSYDGGVLALGGRKGDVRTWDCRSGAPLAQFTGADSDVNSVAFDSTGRWLAAGCKDGTTVVWDVSTRSVETRIRASGSPVRLVRFDDAIAGGELHALTGDGWQLSSRIGAWADVRRARLSDRTVSSAAGWPGRPLVAVGDTAGFVRIVDPSMQKTSSVIRPVSEPIIQIGFVAMGSDLKYDRVVAYSEREAVIWDPDSGATSVVPGLIQHRAAVLVFRPDGSRLFTGSEYLESASWKQAGSVPPSALVFSGTLAWGPHRYISNLHQVAFGPNGETVVTGNATGLHVFNGATGKPDRDIAAHLGVLDGCAVSPDGRSLAVASHSESASGDGTISAPERREIRVWSLENEASSFVLDEPLSRVDALAYLPSGRLVTADLAGSIRVWDVEARRIEASSTVPESAPISSVAVCPNGGPLAVSSDYRVTLWDPATLRPIRSLTGHAATVGAISFSPDGRLLVSGSVDGTARVWDVASGEHLATLISLLDDDDWLVVTPDGLFDGSPDAWSRIRWRFGDSATLLPVEAFFADFYTPGLLAEIVAGGRPTARRDIAAIDRRQPTVSLRIGEARPNPVSARTARVEVDVAELSADASHASSSGATDVRLFRNGSLVKAWRGDVLGGRKSARLTATVPLVAGTNAFTAYAFNRDGVKSTDARTTVTGADSLARPREAHVVVVGVSNYANRDFDLRFAAADARAFAAETRARLQTTGDFASVDVVELIDGRATRQGILDAIGRLANVGPDDAVFVFFAGHGIRNGDRFYLVPHDLGYEGSRDALDSAALDRIAARAISDRDLERAFESVDSANIALVVDACFAGAVLGDTGTRVGPLNARGLGQLAYEKGMAVLAAAGRDQRAIESESLGHGVLTYALVEEGLGKAEADDEPADGELYLDEWLEFATRRVPQLHDRLAREAVGREIVHAADAAGGLQTPRLFSRSGGNRRRLRIATFTAQ